MENDRTIRHERRQHQRQTQSNRAKPRTTTGNYQERSQ
jgi:hypothetical protein